jgi:hypothetical protein
MQLLAQNIRRHFSGAPGAAAIERSGCRHWTAYYLLRTNPALRVAMVVKEIVGFGASGRNDGWCSSRFPVTPSVLEDRFKSLSSPHSSFGHVRCCGRSGPRLRRGKHRGRLSQRRYPQLARRAPVAADSAVVCCLRSPWIGGSLPALARCGMRGTRPSRGTAASRRHSADIENGGRCGFSSRAGGAGATVPAICIRRLRRLAPVSLPKRATGTPGGTSDIAS